MMLDSGDSPGKARVRESGGQDFFLIWGTTASSFRTLMRNFLTVLLAFCVFAGLNARVLAVTCTSASECGKVTESCCQDDNALGSPADEHHDGGDCPMEHHHHGLCSHGLPLGVDIQTPARLTLPGSLKLSFRHEGDMPPDGPFLGSEKPPLI